ncbi:MAG: glycosyltransferase family 9 protein [Burkholderiales bacterium]|nr:glycosyltransferase family 9 protein [Burkholderiales bacterium]
MAALLEFSPTLVRPRIGVFRALQLGDMLCAIPAMRALRRALPRAHITLIGLPWAAGFVTRFHRYIDAHAAFPGYPGLCGRPGDFGAIPEFMAAMQRQHFDLMLQMHGCGTLSNPMMMAFGAVRNAGFYREGEYCPDARSFLRWDERQHEIQRNLQLMECLGVPSCGEDLEFPLIAADSQNLQTACMDLPSARSYVCLHPGARLAARRWPTQKFAALADTLSQAGLQVVLTGSKRETGLIAAVEREMRSSALNLAGAIDVGAFAALAAQARLVVCNDTGIVHIAAAVRTPSVAICCSSDPRRWAPLNARRHRFVRGDGEGSLDMALKKIHEVLVDNPVVHSHRYAS